MVWVQRVGAIGVTSGVGADSGAGTGGEIWRGFLTGRLRGFLATSCSIDEMQLFRLAANSWINSLFIRIER